MGATKRAGIIAGIIVVSLLGILAYDYQDTYSDDARLAQLTATYFDDQDRLRVALILTNSDGEFTKANGHILITINTRGKLYAYEYDFVKDDFLTWNNPFLGKQKGVWFDIHERFPGGGGGMFGGIEYDVYATLELKSGSNWERLHTSFDSYE